MQRIGPISFHMMQQHLLRVRVKIMGLIIIIFAIPLSPPTPVRGGGGGEAKGGGGGLRSGTAARSLAPEKQHTSYRPRPEGAPGQLAGLVHGALRAWVVVIIGGSAATAALPPPRRGPRP
jgi:hypothetical protein